MKMQLILATNNQNKLRELREMLAELPLEVLSQAEAGFTIEVEETGKTFSENAELKARALWETANNAGIVCYTLADDSGLCVDALHDAPGVYSHRYAGADASDADRNAKLLAALAETPAGARGARFVCAMALVAPDGTVQCFQGAVHGEIGFAPRGENGFGYDPLFYVGERSFAELSAAEKNTISHRKRALEQVIAALAARITTQ